MNTELFSLAGKVALVTGATRGIGLAVARAYAQAGAEVVVSSEDLTACETVAAQLQASGLKASALAADLASEASVDALCAALLTRHGGIDLLVCNAGIAPHMGPLAEASEAQWHATFTVNLRSAAWLTCALIPGMVRRGGGRVVLMASIAGVRGNRGLGLYGLSKAALAQLARNLAVEWGPSGITVNAISPGVIGTEFARPLTDDPERMRGRLALTPLRRIGTPTEVAALALLLAAPGGGFITGQNIIVDGGTTISDGQ